MLKYEYYIRFLDLAEQILLTQAVQTLCYNGSGKFLHGIKKLNVTILGNISAGYYPVTDKIDFSLNYILHAAEHLDPLIVSIVFGIRIVSKHLILDASVDSQSFIIIAGIQCGIKIRYCSVFISIQSGK